MRNKTFMAFAAGIVLGILFAPDKGSATRKKIAGSAADLADSIKSQCNDLSDKVKDFIQDSKDSLAGIVKDTTNTLREEELT